MDIEVAFTARQLDLLHQARDRDAPDQRLEEYIATAFSAETERDPASPDGGDEAR